MVSWSHHRNSKNSLLDYFIDETGICIFLTLPWNQTLETFERGCHVFSEFWPKSASCSRRGSGPSLEGWKGDLLSIFVNPFVFWRPGVLTLEPSPASECFFCLWPSGFGRPGIAVNMEAPGCQFSEIDHGSPPTLESFWNVSNMPLAWQRALQGVGYLWRRPEGEGQ